MPLKRVALLYGNAGGGHRSAAEAIAQGIRATFPETVRPFLVNGLQNAPSPIKELVETYPQIVNQARLLYALGYHAVNDRRLLTAIRQALEPLTEPRVDELIAQNPADAYVSCHPLFNSAFPHALRKLGRTAPFIHVVTDLVSGHVMHYDDSVDYLIVPTEEARRDAIHNHVPVHKIAVCGQPVWPDFRQRMGNAETRARTRAELGFDERPVLLLMGGGDGMGRIESIARELMFSNLPIQLIVVCGRNEHLKANLDEVFSRIPSRVLGFVRNVPELMGSADLLATKAGPSTICEGFIAGLPIILFDAVPGQEEGNVDYVVSSGAGAWCPSPIAVRKQIEYWLENARTCRATSVLSSTLARPDSALDIAKIVGRHL
jgi:1,2-diacylglycerol 3-beta-galactosyltransferase